MGLDAGAMTPSMFCFRGRERIQGLFESVSGARMMHNYFPDRGLKEDVPDDFVKQVREVLDLVKQDTEESDKLLSFNEIFLARLKNIAVMSAEDAVDYGLTGPCLRASGVDYDVRKAAPYSVYDRFAFDVPVGLDGDCWDRYYLRVQEVYQSIRIIEQALEQLPEGDVLSSLGGDCFGRRPARFT
ncbi:MAG: hypothetical protein Ct9H300mP11_29440 [Chloroflexota bacterium]|nr:MAG: hypothetical protein Ct9H300mP11_29440 [Chloroflexota bacterium]